MFKKLAGILEGSVGLDKDSSGEPTTEDLQIATGVLLLEMSGRDEDYAPEEVRAIFLEMKAQFGIEDEHEIMALLEKATDLREEKEKIDSFVQTLIDNYSEEQRSLILSMAWKVILADGEIEKAEKRFAKQLATRLQLSEETYNKAIEKVMEGLI